MGFLGVLALYILMVQSPQRVDDRSMLPALDTYIKFP